MNIATRDRWGRIGHFVEQSKARVPDRQTVDEMIASANAVWTEREGRWNPARYGGERSHLGKMPEDAWKDAPKPGAIVA